MKVSRLKHATSRNPPPSATKLRLKWNTIFAGWIVWLCFGCVGVVKAQPVAQEQPAAGGGELSDRDLINAAVKNLVRLQHEDGAWPYEGVYRVGGKIPVGYRVGGTAIVCTALLSAVGDDREKQEAVVSAIEKGARQILVELEHPLMQPIQSNRYDVRIWGHIYALDFFCRLKEHPQFDALRKETDPWLSKLVDAIVFQEIKTGGWNYANQTSQGCFVTAPAVQALLLARQQGIEVSDSVLERAADALAGSRSEKGVFAYSGPANRRDTLAGSIARGPVSEVTLILLGKGDPIRLQSTVDSFFEHWEQLEKRRKKTGTHLPPHGIAPYYFYYGHRYLAQAIRFLPEENRKKEMERFRQVLLKTKDEDQTWNDRVFEQSKAFGTAMAVLALANNEAIPEKLVAKTAE